MRTTRSFTMVIAVIAAGFLVFATISSAAFATCSNSHSRDTSSGGTNNGGSTSASATSSISQSNTQSATCTAGTSKTGSCNQLAET
jgi:hypothetical protein